MANRIVIDPVIRIEGHAKISIYLDARGEVTDARFHVTELRGFEKFCEGRPFWEMPKRSGSTVLAAAIAFHIPHLGVMLPTTPLHHLLLQQYGSPLVATSGN